MSAQALQALIRLLDEAPDPGVVTDPESWALIREYSGVYGVRGLTAYAARPFLPPGERVWCDRVLTNHLRRYEQSLLHLEAIAQLLGNAGVPLLFLKGPLLARRHYSPPFLRKPSVDLDLGVCRRDMDKACRVLAGIGYQQCRTLEEAAAYSYDVALLHETMPRVELHFRLSHGSLGIPVEEFFGRAVSADLPHGGQALVLPEADEILHLVLHYAHHRFPMLFNLIEIRRIWRKAAPEIRTQVVRRAQEHHFLAVLAMTDIAFRSTWGEPFLPPGTNLPKTWLHNTLNERLYRECVSWSQPGFQLTLGTRLKGRWLDFQLTDDLSDALKFLGMIARVSWYRLRRRGWRTHQHRHFAVPAARDANSDNLL